MGAIGASRVKANLEEQGHSVLELERGSTGYKIWKGVKIKRIRVPDLLCIESGFRVESRAKSQPIISMSHSTNNPERAWDFGMDDSDFVAIVVCHKQSPDPTDWIASDLVQYVSVRDLRATKAAGLVKEEQQKGVQEGSESRITWLSTAVKYRASISEITDQRIKVKQLDGNRTQSYKLTKSKKAMVPLGQIGDEIVSEQLISSVVPVTRAIPVTPIDFPAFYYVSLGSASLSKRYAAAKVLSRVNTSQSIELLSQRMNDRDEHIYVRLESAASLAKLDQELGWTFIRACLADDQLAHRLEAVLVLSEIDDPISRDLLIMTLSDVDQNAEIRAGSAWALGEMRSPASLETLIECFNDHSQAIRLESARALLKLVPIARQNVLSAYSESEGQKIQGIAWALSRSGGVTDLETQNLRITKDHRIWLSYILGVANDAASIEMLENLRDADPEVYFAATVLLTVARSWVSDLGLY